MNNYTNSIINLNKLFIDFFIECEIGKNLYPQDISLMTMRKCFIYFYINFKNPPEEAIKLAPMETSLPAICAHYSHGIEKQD